MALEDTTLHLDRTDRNLHMPDSSIELRDLGPNTSRMARTPRFRNGRAPSPTAQRKPRSIQMEPPTPNDRRGMASNPNTCGVDARLFHSAARSATRHSHQGHPLLFQYQREHTFAWGFDLCGHR